MSTASNIGMVNSCSSIPEFKTTQCWKHKIGFILFSFLVSNWDSYTLQLTRKHLVSTVMLPQQSFSVGKLVTNQILQQWISSTSLTPVYLKNGFNELYVQTSKLLLSYIRTAVPELWSQTVSSWLWTMYGKARPSLPRAIFSRQAPRHSSFLSEPKSNYFFVWHSIRRQGCVASVGQPPLGLVM